MKENTLLQYKYIYIVVEEKHGIYRARTATTTIYINATHNR